MANKTLIKKEEVITEEVITEVVVQFYKKYETAPEDKVVVFDSLTKAKEKLIPELKAHVKKIHKRMGTEANGINILAPALTGTIQLTAAIEKLTEDAPFLSYEKAAALLTVKKRLEKATVLANTQSTEKNPVTPEMVLESFESFIDYKMTDAIRNLWATYQQQIINYETAVKNNKVIEPASKLVENLENIPTLNKLLTIKAKELKIEPINLGNFLVEALLIDGVVGKKSHKTKTGTRRNGYYHLTVSYKLNGTEHSFEQLKGSKALNAIHKVMPDFDFGDYVSGSDEKGVILKSGNSSRLYHEQIYKILLEMARVDNPVITDVVAKEEFIFTDNKELVVLNWNSEKSTYETIEEAEEAK